jgi:glycosyltransferase involved in cell wall biosynthesis
MEDYVKENGVESVHFFGFQDRLQIPKYYAVADVLVLPSKREATGGVVNEAMAFGLPVIVSDQVGFGVDFVVHGANGYIFPVGNSSDLGEYMQNISEQTDEVIQEMGAKSQKVMDDWLSRDLPENLVQYLEQTRSKAGRKTGQAGQ